MVGRSNSPSGKEPAFEDGAQTFTHALGSCVDVLYEQETMTTGATNIHHISWIPYLRSMICYRLTQRVHPLLLAGLEGNQIQTPNASSFDVCMKNASSGMLPSSESQIFGVMNQSIKARISIVLLITAERHSIALTS
jgi:hypothetical protein